MTKGQQRKDLARALNKIKVKELMAWVDEASKISPEMRTALEGIYCGRDGEIHVEVTNDLWLKMGWHTVDVCPKVEFAYIS